MLKGGTEVLTITCMELLKGDCLVLKDSREILKGE